MKIKEVRTSNINNTIWGNNEIEEAVITKEGKGYYVDCQDYDLTFSTLKELKTYLRTKKLKHIGWN